MSSVGCGRIAVEMIKRAAETIDKKILNMFNHIAETADKQGQLDTIYSNHSKNVEKSNDHQQTCNH